MNSGLIDPFFTKCGVMKHHFYVILCNRHNYVFRIIEYKLELR